MVAEQVGGRTRQWRTTGFNALLVSRIHASVDVPMITVLGSSNLRLMATLAVDSLQQFSFTLGEVAVFDQRFCIHAAL